MFPKKRNDVVKILAVEHLLEVNEDTKRLWKKKKQVLYTMVAKNPFLSKRHCG